MTTSHSVFASHLKDRLNVQSSFQIPQRCPLKKFGSPMELNLKFFLAVMLSPFQKQR